MKVADRIKSLTEDQLEMLDFCFSMWVNTDGKPSEYEVIITFYWCETLTYVVWSSRSLLIAIAWLKEKGIIA